MGLIYIFLKSCTTIKNLYNQRKKLYIFGTLSVALNFIHNDVCSKMYSFFQSYTNSVVLIYIFEKAVYKLKSCPTKGKSCTSLVHCPGLLILLTMVFVPKCTVFSKALQILWSSFIYFLESCTTIEKLYNQRKKLYNQRKKLYIFGTLYLALNFIHNGVCTKM